MSIYATLWELRFPKYGDDHHGCEWIEVIAQAVPPHIGSPTSGMGYEEGDPYGEFLPPPLETDKDGQHEYMRAVIIVTEQTKKGTFRNPQEYQNPLLVLTGEEYNKISFAELHSRICDKLRGDNPRVFGQMIEPDGSIRILYEDGTKKDIEQ